MSILVHYLGGFIIHEPESFHAIHRWSWFFLLDWVDLALPLHIFPLYIRSELDRCTVFDLLKVVGSIRVVWCRTVCDKRFRLA